MWPLSSQLPTGMLYSKDLKPVIMLPKYQAVSCPWLCTKGTLCLVFSFWIMNFSTFFFFKAQLGGFLPYEGLSSHSILDPHMPGPYFYSILIKQHDNHYFTRNSHLLDCQCSECSISGSLLVLNKWYLDEEIKSSAF